MRPLYPITLTIIAFTLLGCNPPITYESLATPTPYATKNAKGQWVSHPPRCERVYRQKERGKEKVFVVENNLFGCATTKNLGMMVANPKDLMKPKKTTEYTGAIQTEAVSNVLYGGQANATGGGSRAR